MCKNSTSTGLHSLLRISWGDWGVFRPAQDLLTLHPAGDVTNYRPPPTGRILSNYNTKFAMWVFG
jgi:hypothetical protein